LRPEAFGAIAKETIVGAGWGLQVQSIAREGKVNLKNQEDAGAMLSALAYLEQRTIYERGGVYWFAYPREKLGKRAGLSVPTYIRGLNVRPERDSGQGVARGVKATKIGFRVRENILAFSPHSEAFEAVDRETRVSGAQIGWGLQVQSIARGKEANRGEVRANSGSEYMPNRTPRAR
jgi:hypothetical protein